MDGILLLDKPAGMTSSDAVIRLRHLLPSPHVGHTGTLDPLATGLLVCMVGRATKILPFIKDHRKSYQATMVLGHRTDTGDVTGVTIASMPVPKIDGRQAEAVINQLIGPQMQVPPMYSAKKVDGHKLYEYARRNQQVERQAVSIVIHRAVLEGFDGQNLSFALDCSAGTYVRVVCEDIAQRLGTVGTMSSLRRNAVGPFTISDAYTLEQVAAGGYELLDIRSALTGYPYIEIDDTSSVLTGRPLEVDCQEPVIMIGHQGQIIAAYQLDAPGHYRCLRGLWS